MNSTSQPSSARDAPEGASTNATPLAQSGYYDPQAGPAPQSGYYDPQAGQTPQSGHYDPRTGYTYPAYPAPSEPKTLSITSFSLGIASVLFSFTLLVPVAAIVLGFLARTREPAGRTLATWGIVLGFVMALGWALGLLAVGGIAIAAIPFLAVL